jgi:hypothetical protein
MFVSRIHIIIKTRREIINACRRWHPSQSSGVLIQKTTSRWFFITLFLRRCSLLKEEKDL